MFNPLVVRKDFPLFERRIHGKPIVYLDSAATSLKPRQVLDEMWKYYTEYSANIHRGIYTISEEATAAYEHARQQVATFIGAQSSSEIIFTRGTTESINLIAATYGMMNIGSEDTIVNTIVDHHANFVPWQQLAVIKKCNYRVLLTDQEGIIEQKLLNKYITRKTKVFAFPSVSNVLGTIQDVPKIVVGVKQIAPECIVIVDAAQYVPHENIDVQAWNADFIVFSGHKMLGPTGIGVLWGKNEHLQRMPPYQFGGDMIKEVHIKNTLFADPPQRFEAGTPDIAQAIGLGAATEYLCKMGLDAVVAHEKEVVGYALDIMRRFEGITIYGPVSVTRRAGVIPFTMKGIHPHDIAQVLNEDNVCIRAGHHCAMPLHTHLGLPATARASFYLYSTKEDVDVFIASLEKAKKLFT